MTQLGMTARESVLMAIAAAGCVIAAASAASAQSYPQRPVKIIVDRPAGSPHDLITRAMADNLSANLKQTFVVDNRTGAGGNLAAEFVARSAPDGYTLLVALDTTLTANPTLYKHLSFDPQTDLRPLSIIAKSSTMLVVHPSIPVNSVAELVAYARKNPITYAHGGNGSPAIWAWSISACRPDSRPPQCLTAAMRSWSPILSQARSSSASWARASCTITCARGV